MDNGIYVVTKEGVYTQGIMGIYNDFSDAKKRADSLAADDSDDYHQYLVARYELDVTGSPESLYSCRKEVLNIA